MASAGTEHHSPVLKRRIPHRPSAAAGSFVANSTQGPQKPKSRLLVPQLQVKPIWRLQKKQVPVIEARKHALSEILPQNTYYFFPGQLTTSDASNLPLRTVFSAPLNQTCLPRDHLASTLVFQQSHRAHKPYQKLESLCLRSEVVRRRVCSPSRDPFTELPANTFAISESAMTSSFVDQFHPPSAAGEPPSIGIRTTTRSRKVTSASCKPALNTNSFLRPNSAAVPSYLAQESRKVKNPRMSAGSTSWQHPGGNGDGTTCHRDAVPSKSNSVINASHINSSAVCSVNSESNQKGPQTSCKLDDAESRRGRSETRDQGVRLTEAVRKLTQNGFSKNHLISEVALCNTSSTTLSSHEAPNATCKRKAQTVLLQKTKEEGDHAPHSGHLCLNGELSLANSQSANAHPELATADSSTSNPDSSVQVISQRTVSVPRKRKDAKPKGEDGPLMNVTAVATQISTIQLDKNNGLKDTSIHMLGVQNGDTVSVPEVRFDGATISPLLDFTEAAQEATQSFSEMNKHLQQKNISPAGDVQQLNDTRADDLEEELADGLEDCCSMPEDEVDDESDSSVAGIPSSASMLLISRKCMEEPPEVQEKICKPAFLQSMFPNVTPTLYFGTRNETVEILPWEQRKLLKWRLSTVTPNVVKQAIARSHFRITKKNHDWLGCWGHHMKSPVFKTILEHQKLNHFPGSFQIGRKDRLWRNLSKMQARFGRKEFNFFPQSFVLPVDIKLLKKAWEESGTRQKWIVKPPASARGIGIQVIHKWSQLPKRRPLLVQRYLHKPYLISGSKFDLRIYVYVTSFDPLRVYMFTDGLVRFASCKYSSSMKSLGNKFMHLTNYSVNKKNSEYKSNADETACQGHKWALRALWSYLNEKGISSDKIWEKIKDIVIKTIIASEPYVNSFAKMYLRRPYCCHELFGFDIMLDENLKPWILEVNISPSLHSNSPLDMNIKGQMISDLLNLAGFVLPNKDDVTAESPSASSSSTSLINQGKEKSRMTPELYTEEKMKRAYYLSQKMPDEDFYSSILDTLTPDDIRTLVETEDEYSRRGQFERVFPSPISGRYLRFFEQPRYLNILLNQWEQKYRDHKEKGLELLKSFCQKGYHTGMISDPTHLENHESKRKKHQRGPM
ncbi:tubulin monoglutamylase TTLL4 isoform X2 [Pleurodeles waltl]|uniref:tubulin monoglutamylase TTLL4 isoform X2 n=1 Tax=Pleurodeles waltl TaxID=8319 RepID=UPI003709876E